MNEPADGREWGPADAEGCADPTMQTAEPTRGQSPPERPTQPSPPAATAPLVLLPRAAGGGAGGVAAPVLLADAQARERRATEPETVPAEPPTAPSWPDVAPSHAPAPPEPEDADTVIGGPPALPTAEIRLEHAAIEHALRPLPSVSPAIDATRGKPPALPTIEARLERAAVERAFSPPQAPIHLTPPPAAPARPWPEALLPPAPETKRAPRRYLRLTLVYAAAGALALTGLVLALVVLYRWVDPPASTLMLGQRLIGTPITQRWVPLARISPNLQLAAILSEDARFCRHSGVDWGELKEAIEGAGDGFARGGSTISMQVVKNLFLWPSRSYLRKAIEIPLAYAIEAAWSKPRILEIYLNIAEWGPGVFGAEAAARYHFRKPASLLSPHEAALLAVSLPNPFERQASSPGPGTLRLADSLLLRMRASQGNAACVRTRPAGR